MVFTLDPSVTAHPVSSEPQDVLQWALSSFSRERVAVCTSFQAEGMVVLDMAWRIDPSVRVFTVDTGRLPQETYQLIDQVRDRYGMNVEVYFPEAMEVEELVRENGVDLFHRGVDLRLACCQVRKVHPLKRVLSGLDAWITGLRRNQWTTRATIDVVQTDDQHGGIAKVNPLATWTEDQVWDYIRNEGVPYNTLYDQGYRSIGCAPCTRSVAPGESARAGRWWWEADGVKECGMHYPLELTGGRTA